VSSYLLLTWHMFLSIPPVLITFYTRLLLFLTHISRLCYSLTMFVPIDNDRSHVYQYVLLLLSLFVQELLAYAMYDQGMHVTVLTS
jgi:hypothetical protein